MLVLMLTLACASTEDVAADQVACDTLDGSIHAVTASATADQAAAAQFHVADHPHQITLTDGAGFVWTEVTEDTQASLHFDTPDAIVSVAMDGQAVELDAPVENAACPDLLPAVYTHHFHAGAWDFELAGGAEVWLVPAVSGETHDHEH